MPLAVGFEPVWKSASESRKYRHSAHMPPCLPGAPIRIQSNSKHISGLMTGASSTPSSYFQMFKFGLVEMCRAVSFPSVLPQFVIQKHVPQVLTIAGLSPPTGSRIRKTSTMAPGTCRYDFGKEVFAVSNRQHVKVGPTFPRLLAAS